MDVRSAAVSPLRNTEASRTGDTARNADSASMSADSVGRDFAGLLREQQMADRLQMRDRQAQDLQIQSRQLQDRQIENRRLQDQQRLQQEGRQQQAQRRQQDDAAARADADHRAADNQAADNQAADKRAANNRAADKRADAGRTDDGSVMDERATSGSAASAEHTGAGTTAAAGIAEGDMTETGGVGKATPADAAAEAAADKPGTGPATAKVETPPATSDESLKTPADPQANAAAAHLAGGKPATATGRGKTTASAEAGEPAVDDEEAGSGDAAVDTAAMDAAAMDGSHAALPSWLTPAAPQPVLADTVSTPSPADTLHTFFGDPTATLTGTLNAGTLNAGSHPQPAALPGGEGKASGHTGLSPYQQAMLDNVNLPLQDDQPSAVLKTDAAAMAVSKTDADSATGATLTPLPASGERVPLAAVAAALPPVAHAMTGRLAAQIVWMQSQNLQRADLRLSPDELGSLHIQLDLSRDQTVVNVSAAHAQVRDWLHANGDHLRQLMQDAGLQLTGYHVSEHTPEYTQQQGFAQQSSGQSQGGQGDEAPRWTVIGADSHSEGEAQPLQPMRVGLGLVDSYA